MTAHIAAGIQNEGGIAPLHTAWLFEHHRPAWMFERTSSAVGGHAPDAPSVEIRWIPAEPDTILRDGLLMMIIHSLRDEATREAAAGLPELLRDTPGQKDDGDNLVFVEVGDIDPVGLAEVNEVAKRAIPLCKLVITALNGSSILTQLGQIAEFAFETEVCTPTYFRERPVGHWDVPKAEDPPLIIGSLKPPEDFIEGGRYDAIRFRPFDCRPFLPRRSPRIAASPSPFPTSFPAPSTAT